MDSNHPICRCIDRCTDVQFFMSLFFSHIYLLILFPFHRRLHLDKLDRCPGMYILPLYVTIVVQNKHRCSYYFKCFFLLLFYIITYIYCLFYHSCLLIDPFLFLSCHYFKGHTCPVPICTSTKSNISNLCEVGCKNITASIRTLGMYATNYTAERITAPYAHLPRIVCVYEAHLASLSHTHTHST